MASWCVKCNRDLDGSPATCPHCGAAFVLAEGDARDRQRALARQFDLPAIVLEQVIVDPHVIALLPSSLAAEHQVLPVHATGGVLVVAVADPGDTTALDAVGEYTGLRIQRAVATPDELRRAIHEYYGGGW